MAQPLLYLFAREKIYYTIFITIKRRVFMILKKILISAVLSLFVVGSVFAQVDNSNIDQLIKRLGEKIQKVTPIVEKSGSVEAKATLVKGVEHYNKAIEFNTLGKKQEALRELNVSAKLVEKAYLQATGQTAIEQMIKRLGLYIEKVKVVVDKSGNKEALAILEKGVEHYNAAIKFNADGKKKEALVQLKISAKLVAKAEAIAKASIAMGVRIERLGLRIAVVKVLVDKSTNPEAKKVFDLGVETYTKAVDLYKNGKLREAMVNLNITAKLIEKAARLATL
jgi:tetratricopeptide (TPR) repeat protein